MYWLFSDQGSNKINDDKYVVDLFMTNDGQTDRENFSFSRGFTCHLESRNEALPKRMEVTISTGQGVQLKIEPLTEGVEIVEEPIDQSGHEHRVVFQIGYDEISSCKAIDFKVLNNKKASKRAQVTRIDFGSIKAYDVIYRIDNHGDVLVQGIFDNTNAPILMWIIWRTSRVFYVSSTHNTVFTKTQGLSLKLPTSTLIIWMMIEKQTSVEYLATISIGQQVMATLCIKQRWRNSILISKRIFIRITCF